MAQKYIINDGEIIMGNVEFHFELIGKHRDRAKTIGGGRWQWDRQNKKVCFYGNSFDFGAVTKEQFQEAIHKSMISPFMEDCRFYFTNALSPESEEENLIIYP